MCRPLITSRFRLGALSAIALAGLVTTWLAVLSYHSGSTSLDRWALNTSLRHIGPDGARFLLDTSEPALSAGVLLLVAAAAAVLRRWEIVVLAAVGPVLALVVTEYALKPLIDRTIGGIVLRGQFVAVYVGAFPSGHETGVASVALVVFVAAGQLRLGRAARTALVGVLTAWIVVAAAGLVRNFYHWATDTAGAVGVSVVVVLTTACAIDRWYAPLTDRLRPRAGIS